MTYKLTSFVSQNPRACLGIGLAYDLQYFANVRERIDGHEINLQFPNNKTQYPPCVARVEGKFIRSLLLTLLMLLRFLVPFVRLRLRFIFPFPGLVLLRFSMVAPGGR